MGKVWNKFILLIWKNYKLQTRHPIQTILEVLAPVLFAVTLLVLRSLIPLNRFDAISFPPFKPTIPSTANMTRVLVWSPYNEVLDKIVDNTVNSINEKHNIMLQHRSFQNSTMLSQHLANEINIFATLAAIEFDEELENLKNILPQINITFRFPAELRSSLKLEYGTWRTNSLFPRFEPGPREESLIDGGLPSYNAEGFLLLQQEVSFAIIRHLKTSYNQTVPTLPEIYMQRFPYPAWNIDKLMKQIETSVGIIFLLAYIYTSINIVKTVTYEKEKQIKEVMKIMGLPNWLHWTVWTLRFFISLSITAALMVIVMETGWYPSTNLSVFTQTDPNILFTFLMCFSCATISYCFAISAFFTNASTAATFTGLLWFLSYVPYYFVEQFYSRYTFSVKMATCLCSNTAMAYGFRLLLRYEGAHIGIHWDDVWQLDSKDPTLGHVMIMLMADSVIYYIIALYVGAVFPGHYGVPEKWYFPFSYTYWFGQAHEKDESSLKEELAENEHFEKEPVHLEAGIKIKNLTKQFSKKRLAVENLTLNMYKNQISVVLGHNGAGKTTTMSMIIGMFPPTCGTAIVGGCDIRSNINGVRRSLGLCPQHNVLFDELTVSEHLYFYSRLKGVDKHKVNGEIAKYTKLLELESKADAQTSKLSGGMKRKLSVAVALCGNSEVVVLDEPTAGMDPSARRLLWDLLQAEKKGRTVVLTTHFMDEADFLGDRIAIMSNGKLQCCGSSFFLKKKYGAGYHLIVDKMQNCNIDNVTILLRRYIPNIQVRSNVGFELVYLLSDEFSNTFQEMLRDLERSAEGLGINGYGISLTTLEEVFMKVGAENQDCKDEYYISNKFNNNETCIQNSNIFNEITYSSQSKFATNDELLSGWKLWINQIHAMFMKRFLSIIRNWILVVVQIIIPIAFVIFIIMIILQVGSSVNLPKLNITLEYYTDPITLLSTNRNNPYVDSYIELLSSKNYSVIHQEGVDLNTKILKLTSQRPVEVRYQYIIGATMHANQTITGWFNNIPFHSAPLSLQTIVNAILHKEVSPEFNIYFNNHPLGYSFINTKLVSLLDGHSEGTTLSLNIAFSMAFVSSFYVLFYIKERINKSKHLQFVSGMNVMPFWIPSFLLDFLTFTITSLCLVMIMAPFQINGFSTISELGNLLLLLSVFGISMLPVMYLSSVVFENPSTGYTRMTFLNIFNGVGAYLVIRIIKSPDLNLGEIGNVLDWIFSIFPHYSLTGGINGITMVNAINSICETVVATCVGTKILNLDKPTRLQCKVAVCFVEKRCCNADKLLFAWEPPGILLNIVLLTTVGVLSFTILFCIEYEIFRKLRYKLCIKASKGRNRSIPNTNEDSDVAVERQKVHNMRENELSNTSLVVTGITKYYGNTAVVQNISLMVQQYECFGLLGVNGAGKTTTFKMMTGDIKPTSGNAWIYGLSLNIDMKAIQRMIGYCPQFDALLDELTARETLIVFGLIRGVPKINVKLLAEKLSHDFNFEKHLDKQVKELSGGNKRKLSTALALIGDPVILYLDEPTTGMDPATKRYLWNCISRVRNSGKCIVLTSHSMEECEALCTRIAIMVNGQFMCLGSTQHLKNKFSNTCTLTIKVKRKDDGEVGTDEVVNFVNQNFHYACLREHHKDLLIFNISDNQQKWSDMFGLMEHAKQFLDIDDYSLGQCSLEQVFLRFTKYQVDDKQ